MRRYIILFSLAGITGCAQYLAKPLNPAQTAAQLESRRLDDPGLKTFLEQSLGHSLATWPLREWEFNTLSLAAFYYQPALAEARAQWRTVKAGETTAAQRPNPSVSVTPGYDAGIPDNPSPWLVPISFDWPIETAGKRGYRTAQAQHLSEAARWDLAGAVWQARSAVRSALVNFYEARETESLLARQEMAQSNVVRLLAGQLAAGSISSYEASPARGALVTTQIARLAAFGQINQTRAALAVALGVTADALDGIQFSFAGMDKFPRQLTAPEIKQRALLDRADVRSALASYAASQSALQLEIANQWPDVHLGPGYAWNNGSAGDNEWSLGLTVTLPMLNQNQGPIREAEAKRNLAAAHFLTVQSAAIGEIDSALIGCQTARQQVVSARGLAENARQRLNSIRAQTEGGEMEPVDLANAEVEDVASAQAQLTALLQAQRAFGQLEDAMQSPLTLVPATLRAVENEATPKSISEK